ncbi:MAG: hypothetical protein ACR2NU_12325 [Aeoliella sp.]
MNISTEMTGCVEALPRDERTVMVADPGIITRQYPRRAAQLLARAGQVEQQGFVGARTAPV